jgi:outer membrane protein insertion porin family
LGILISISLIGCATSHIPNRYIGAKVELSDEDTEATSIQEDLEQLIRPRPANPVKVAIYQRVAPPKKEKGIRKFIRQRLGQPPTLYAYEPLDRSRANMEQWLRNHGYFEANIQWDTLHTQKGVLANYLVATGPRYTLRRIDWPSDTVLLGPELQRARVGSLLKSGRPYQLDHLDQERKRLSAQLASLGYYGYSADLFYYYVDTLQTSKQVDLYLQFKLPEDSLLHRPVYIGQTQVFTNFELGKNPLQQWDTLRYKDLEVLQTWPVLKPRKLERYLVQKKGDLYQPDAEQLSANHLLGLGIFQFINTEVAPRQEQGKTVLDRYFYLTPRPPQEVGFDIEANTRSGNFVGSAISLSYLDRNLFRGAERLSVTLSGGVETLLQDQTNLINTLEGRLEANLSVPRLIAPFRLGRESRPWLPRTHLRLETIVQRRTGFFSSNAANLRAGYQFQPGPGRRHTWNPVVVNFTSTYNKSTAFENLLNQNPNLARSFDNIFILGTNYRLELGPAAGTTAQRFNLFFLDAELAGNLAYALGSLVSDTPPFQIFGAPFSQFAKVNADWRWHFKGEKTELILRLVGGVGLPYGNAEVLPFSKQFYAGGSTDLRAFPFRGLGPGSTPPSPTDGFFDQTGEVKLAYNLEYRFPIFSYLKGAAFVDGGNVWWLRDREGDAPEGLFEWDRFYREIAMGTGLGLRLDVQFVVLRLDVAFPIYKPYLTPGDRWEFESIAPGQKSWRQDNIIWNLAIGYPF